MNNPKLWPVLVIGGGLTMIISTFLNWQEVLTLNGPTMDTAWDKGLLGLYQSIIGALVVGYGAMKFSGQGPEMSVAGLSFGQWMVALPAAAALWGFAMQFDDNPQIGTLVSWVSSVIAAGGTAMMLRSPLAEPANPISTTESEI